MSNNNNPEIYVFASIPSQGKTTTILLLEEKLREKGLKVACLQMNKGQFDVSSYLLKNRYHYSVPLEATKSKAAFEEWVPAGYDRYILEITLPYSPVGAAYVDVFEHFNEVISYGETNDWKEHVSRYYKEMWKKSKHGLGPSQDLTALWDFIHNRMVRTVITKSPVECEGPYVDDQKRIHNIDQLLSEPIRPKMRLPQSKRNVIAVGAFPAEFWDIYPSLKWYIYDYASFMEDFRKKDYGLAIIGACGNKDLKFNDRPTGRDVICYQPTVYMNLEKRETKSPFAENEDYLSVLSILKERPVGTPLCHEGGPFSRHNNRFWVHQHDWYSEPVWKDGDCVFCNGWVLPQYLIRDGYLEVE